MFKKSVIKFGGLPLLFWAFVLTSNGCTKVDTISISDPSKTKDNSSNYLNKIYVDAQSLSAEPDGQTWDKAFKNISQAITAASEEGTAIYVAAGNYQESVDLKDKKNLKLFGGCRVLTDCSERSKDEWSKLDGQNLPKNVHLINITGDAYNIEIAGGFILTGMNNGGSAINIKGEEGKPIRGPNDTELPGGFILPGRNMKREPGKPIKSITVAHSQILNNTKEDDFEISSGAGVLIEHAELIKFTDLTFSKNRASSRGGAIYASDVKDIEIIKSRFTDNEATYGGGVSLQNIQGQAIFDAVDFRYNTAYGRVSNGSAGAISLSQISFPAQVIIRNKCSFVENYGRIFGGAIDARIDASVDIKDSTFDQNKGGFSGALYFQARGSHSKFMIGPGVKFTNNVSEGPDGGGAISIWFDNQGGELSFANQASDISGNTSKSGKGNFLSIHLENVSTDVEDLVKMGTLGISLLDPAMVYIKKYSR